MFRSSAGSMRGTMGGTKKGDLRVRVLQARGLKGLAASSTHEYESPHVQVQIAGQLATNRTTASNQVDDPHWDESLDLELQSLEMLQLLVSLMVTQVDKGSKNKGRVYHGAALIQVRPLTLEPSPKFYQLFKAPPPRGASQEVQDKLCVGELQLQLRFVSPLEEVRRATSGGGSMLLAGAPPEVALASLGADDALLSDALQDKDRRIETALEMQRQALKEAEQEVKKLSSRDKTKKEKVKQLAQMKKDFATIESEIKVGRSASVTARPAGFAAVSGRSKTNTGGGNASFNARTARNFSPRAPAPKAMPRGSTANVDMSDLKGKSPKELSDLVRSERGFRMDLQLSLQRMQDLDHQRQVALNAKVAELEASMKQLHLEKQVADLRLQLEKKNNQLLELQMEGGKKKGGLFHKRTKSSHATVANDDAAASAEMEANPELKSQYDELEKRRVDLMGKMMNCEAPLALMRLKRKEDEVREMERKFANMEQEMSTGVPMAPDMDAPAVDMGSGNDMAATLGAIGAAGGVDMSGLMAKLEQLDKLDSILAKLSTIGSGNMAAMPAPAEANGRTLKEVQDEMAALMKVIMDNDTAHVDREDANIKYEKLAGVMEKMPEFAQAQKQAAEEKRLKNKPINEKWRKKWAKTYSKANIAKDPEINRKVQRNPELALIGMDQATISSMHERDFDKFSMTGLDSTMLRAIAGAMPEWRRHQPRQMSFTETLHLRIDEQEKKEEELKKNPPPSKKFVGKKLKFKLGAQAPKKDGGGGGVSIFDQIRAKAANRKA